jgi:hypothetical protein
MKIRTKGVLSGWLVALALAGSPVSSIAQTTPPATPAPPPAAPRASDPDSRLDPLQPDFNIAALPTTLRLPVHKLAFRVTHRFTRPLGRGDFGDLVSDFFGFDSGARIGLEVRYGLLPGTQVIFHRMSDRTIEIVGQQNLWQQKPDGHPLGIDVIATLEGKNNMRDQKSSTIGVLVSRKVAKVAAVYAEPLFVVNSNPAATSDNNTAMIGLGTRIRIRPATYLIGEVTPRLSGYKPGVAQGSVGIEMRAGGHTFQINFSNGLSTTLGQLTSSGISSDTWMIGFNISRKFF